MNKGESVFNIAAKVTFDQVAATLRFKSGVRNAQKKLDAQVLSDSNYYCPQDTGTLQKTAIIGAVLGSGLLVWETPYARAQYYGESFSHARGRNPAACAKWFEAAKARKLSQWQRIVEDEIKRS